MAKSEGPRCVLTLPLLTEPYQEHILETRFRIAEHLQNSLIALELRKLKNLQRTRAYRDLIQQIMDTPKDQKKERNELYRKRQKMLRDAGFSEYAFKDDISTRKLSPLHAKDGMQKHFSCHIQAQISHTIASDVWRAFDKAFSQELLAPEKCVHFKKRGSLSSVSCQEAGKGMEYHDGLFIWKGGVPKDTQITLTVPVRPPRTDYERQMLALPIKRMRVVRKWMKTRYKYYLQFTLEGTPPRKERPTAPGRIGIDIGTQSIAIASERGVTLRELAPGVKDNHKRLQAIQRKMDASKRATNPENYNSDGTIVRGKKLYWTYSNRYKRLAAQARELQRKNAAIRIYEHNCLANEILALGNEIIVEPMDYKALQRRAKETTKNSSGRFNRKKRFGKSLANKAPATLLTLLEQKCKSNPLGGGLYRVDKWSYRASQYDHLSQRYQKKTLSQRTVRLDNGDWLQRDLYSAFLLMNADQSLTQPDQTRCEQQYANFKQLHDLELDRIRHDHRPHLSSFGV